MTLTETNPASHACYGKAAMTMAQARKVADRMRSRDLRVAAYRCPYCHEWHVGNQRIQKGLRVES